MKILFFVVGVAAALLMTGCNDSATGPVVPGKKAYEPGHPKKGPQPVQAQVVR